MRSSAHLLFGYRSREVQYIADLALIVPVDIVIALVIYEHLAGLAAVEVIGVLHPLAVDDLGKLVDGRSRCAVLRMVDGRYKDMLNWMLLSAIYCSTSSRLPSSEALSMRKSPFESMNSTSHEVS